MRNIFIITLITISILSGISFGEVPNTFTSGTTAKSAEVNANFDFVNYGNIVAVNGDGMEMGAVLGISYGDLFILNDNGYILHVRNTGIYNASHNDSVYYDQLNCSGNKYSSNYNFRGMVFSLYNQIYYISQNAPLTNATLQWSVFYTSDDSCSAMTQSTINFNEGFLPLTLNDPNITGVNMSIFNTPITMKRR